MLSLDPHLLQRLAEVRHQELLKNARIQRLILKSKEEKRKERTWRRWSWQVGSFLVALGHRLQERSRPVL